MASRRKISFGRLISVTLLIVVGLAVVSVLVARSRGNASLGESFITAVIEPVQYGAQRSVQFVVNWFRDSRYTTELELEFNMLRQKYESAQVQLTQFEELQRENERLTEQLGSKERYAELNPLYARVIGKDPGNWFDTFLINRGSSHGVKPNMAVITADGLIGRVFEVQLTASKVLALIDPRSAVGGRIERTRDTGSISGALTGLTSDIACPMYYLRPEKVIPGDRVITSGEDQIFPKGLLIGVVREVSRAQDEQQRYIMVEPAADFSHLEEVFVLLVEPEQREALMTADAPSITIYPRLSPEPTQPSLPYQRPDVTLPPGIDEYTPPDENIWASDGITAAQDANNQPRHVDETTVDLGATDTPQPITEFPEDAWAAH